MASLLSTKKLSTSQKELILNAGISLVEYNAITIEFTEFELPSKSIQNAIITSKNAALALIEKGIKIDNFFCVGEKTKQFLETSNFTVVAYADDAAQLSKKIIEHHRGKKFTFFSGNIRRNELPEALIQNNIEFEEREVYSTQLNPKKFKREFDGILFFSPSAVKSFKKVNEFKNSTLFCIGKTTAAEAEEYTSKIITANKPGIENVIAKAIKHFRTIS